MIQSMTGYGKATAELSNKKITVELKSLNSKQLDLSVRMPGIYREHEMNLRNMIGKELSRGKVDLLIFVENIGEETSSKINQDVIESYYKQISESAKNLNIPVPQDWYAVLLRLPDALKHEIQEADDGMIARKYVSVHADGLWPCLFSHLSSVPAPLPLGHSAALQLRLLCVSRGGRSAVYPDHDCQHVAWRADDRQNRCGGEKDDRRKQGHVPR